MAESWSFETYTYRCTQGVSIQRTVLRGHQTPPDHETRLPG